MQQRDVRQRSARLVARMVGGRVNYGQADRGDVVGADGGTWQVAPAHRFRPADDEVREVRADGCDHLAVLVWADRGELAEAVVVPMGQVSISDEGSVSLAELRSAGEDRTAEVAELVRYGEDIQGEGGRFTHHAAFGLPVDSDRLSEAFETDVELHPLEVVDAELVQELEEGLAYAGLDGGRVRSADVGRGASGPGFVFELGLDATTLTMGFGSLAAGIHYGYKVLRWIHVKVSQKLGRSSTVSLGVAEVYAANDLIERIGEDADFRIAGSGPVETPTDASFTGFEAYYVTYEAQDFLYHYQVSGFGEVTFVGIGPLIPLWMDPEVEPPPPPEL